MASASVLEKICIQRRKDIENAKASVPLETLKKQIANYSLISFPDRIKADPGTAVMAEVKRASPSKGDIAPNIDAAKQGKIYADSGAAVISCLTEPTWFKGTLEDMKGIREAIEPLGHARPALLRKDFILDEYQIYEARAYGADTILLIVAALEEEVLVQLLACARGLGIEPLVEAANAEELAVAIKIGSKVIGINNRNLHNFQVDLDTTKKLLGGVSSEVTQDIIFVALSGIQNRSDVVRYEGSGVKAVLVGEALMMASSPFNKIRELKGEKPTYVKICGIMDTQLAIQTAEAGADFIGLVFAESRRKVDTKKAKEIVDTLKEWRKQQQRPLDIIEKEEEKEEKEKEKGGKEKEQGGWYEKWANKIGLAIDTARPLVVGVFANNDTEFVNSIAQEVGLDLIQLSGKEDLSVITQMSLPALKAFHVSDSTSAGEILKVLQEKQLAAGILLDTHDPKMMGGSGRAFDWSVAAHVQSQCPMFLAGGLNEENISRAVADVKPFAVDVSSGVETEGQKDIAKIRNFIRKAKLATNDSSSSSEEQPESATQSRNFYLYGTPISASPSPLIHNSGFKYYGLDYHYALFDTPDIEAVVRCLKEPQTLGGSVTIPHKQTVMPFLDEISEAAQSIGAVNTVIKDAKGRLIGHNTDWLAIYQLVKDRLGLGNQATEKPAVTGLVIGAGGTAHAACYALSQLGIDYYIFNRTAERAKELASRFAGARPIDSLDQLKAVDVVIGTVPPTAEFSLPPHLLPSESPKEDGDSTLRRKLPLVVELVYHPRVTPLIAQAQSAGLLFVEGIEILLAQGLEQFQIWTNRTPPRHVMTQQLLYRHKEGILSLDPPPSFHA